MRSRKEGAKRMTGAIDLLAATAPAAEERYHIYVFGKYSDALFQMYKVAAEHLANEFEAVEATVQGFFETPYERQLRYIIGKYGGSFTQSKPSAPLVFAETDDSVLYFLNDKRFFEWAFTRFKYEDNTRLIFYRRIGAKTAQKVKDETGRSYCTLSFQIDKDPMENVQFELFDEECPILCKNFMDLMAHPKFDGHPVHRVKAAAWIQAGDLVDGSGAHSFPAKETDLLRHESFQVPHDRAGLLGMCNHGKDTNGSQFYVTLRDLPFLDGKSVIIGRVISGMRTVLKISKLHTNNERPVQEVKIYAQPKQSSLGAIQKARETN